MRSTAQSAGAFLFLVAAGLLALGAVAPWSVSGAVALLGLALAGLALAAPRHRRRFGVAGAVVWVGVISFRAVAVARGGVRLVVLPDASASRWLGSLLDEQDVGVAGAWALSKRWHLPADERKQLVPAMREAYGELRRTLGTTPSPVLDTLLGRQRPAAFDTLVFEPPRPARAGLVFLHGYGGSFTLECWLVARDAEAIDAVTVCPATGFTGHWTGREGEQIVRATLDYLHARGLQRVYLAGLSNGAVGASLLAPGFRKSLEGLILISGAPPTGGLADLPTLVVQGETDSQMSAAAARAYAERTGATYAGYDGGHFVLLTKRAETREAIATWLLRREAGD